MDSDTSLTDDVRRVLTNEPVTNGDVGVLDRAHLLVEALLIGDTCRGRREDGATRADRADLVNQRECVVGGEDGVVTSTKHAVRSVVDTDTREAIAETCIGATEGERICRVAARDVETKIVQTEERIRTATNDAHTEVQLMSEL